MAMIPIMALPAPTNAGPLVSPRWQPIGERLSPRRRLSDAVARSDIMRSSRPEILMAMLVVMLVAVLLLLLLARRRSLPGKDYPAVLVPPQHRRGLNCCQRKVLRCCYRHVWPHEDSRGDACLVRSRACDAGRVVRRSGLEGDEGRAEPWYSAEVGEGILRCGAAGPSCGGTDETAGLGKCSLKLFEGT